MSLLRKGSSKNIHSYPRELARLRFEFSDRVSVFDVGPIPVPFWGLGALRCGIAARAFKVFRDAGLKTHFIRRISHSRILVSAINIPEIRFLRPGAVGRLLPLEILFRFVVTQKFLDRIERGEVDRAKVERLLVGEQGLVVEARMNPPFVECSTKWQAADEYVSDTKAATLAGISCARLREIYENDIRSGAECLDTFFRQAGIELLTGKFEGALLHDGTFVFVDSISPDELQLKNQNGRSVDKDPIRQWYQENQSEWVARVRAAKLAHPNDKSKWPTYEAVPPYELIDEMVNNYREVAEAIGARITM